jgi:hypothetical protein
MFFVLALISCGHEGASIFNAFGWIVLWIIIFVAGLFELKRLKISRLQKIVFLLFVFSPMPVFACVLLMKIFVYSYMLDYTSILDFLMFNFSEFMKFDAATHFFTAFLFCIPLAIYKSKYMSNSNEFKPKTLKF